METAIVVIGGGLWKDGNTWRTIDLGEGEDKYGTINDRWRVEAAYELWKNNPDFLIIASGGKGQLKETLGAPTISSVIKKELSELGVPPLKVLEENKSGTTYEQLKALPNFARLQKIGELKLLSNGWHLPRIKAMLECAPDLKDLFRDFHVELISAEAVLLTERPEYWQKRIEEAKRHPGMKNRLAIEEKGVKQIIGGSYKY